MSAGHGAPRKFHAWASWYQRFKSASISEELQKSGWLSKPLNFELRASLRYVLQVSAHRVSRATMV